MIVNIITNIYVEVKNEDQAERAIDAINMLDQYMNQWDFPGDVVQTDVERYETLTPEQISELGFEE